MKTLSLNRVQVPEFKHQVNQYIGFEFIQIYRDRDCLEFRIKSKSVQYEKLVSKVTPSTWQTNIPITSNLNYRDKSNQY